MGSSFFDGRANGIHDGIQLGDPESRLTHESEIDPVAK
jgi:hypothetical protein